MTPSDDVLLTKELSLVFPTSVAISASGRYVAYAEQMTRWEDNRYASRFLVHEVTKRRPELVVEDARLSCAPQWSPLKDELAFALTNQTDSELHVLQPNVLDNQAVFKEPGTIEKMEWSPKSRTIVAVVAKRKRVAAEYYDVDSPSSSFGLAIYDIVKAERSYHALKNIHRIADISISPTGASAAFVGCPSPDSRDQRSYLYQIQFRGGRLSCLLGSDRAIFSLCWSGDGRQLAFLERKGAWDDLGGVELKTLSVKTLAERSLGQWEYFSRIVAWRKSAIFVAGQREPRKLELYKCSAKTGRCTRATPNSTLLKTQASVNGNACAYLGFGATRFPEIVTENLKRSAPRKVTRYGRQLASLYQGKAKIVSWRSDGVKVDGVLIVPNEASSSPRPAVTVIHGGPVWFVTKTPFNAYIDRWTPYPVRSWLQNGISVFFPNYRGSAGYGEEFRTAIRGRLGQLEARDILSGLQHLADKKLVDDRRIGVAGWSYGGYLAAVLLTHHSERFKVAAVGGGFSDLRLQFYQSCGNLESYLTADPFDPSAFEECLSPLAKADGKCPPTLIQHGACDEVVPPIQSHALHRRLKAGGNRTRMHIYRECGHVLNKPKQMLQAKKDNLDWFMKYLKP